MNFRSIAIAAGMTVALASTNAMALDSEKALSLDVAKAMADGCEAMAKEKGWKMNIAIVDSGADLVLFRRMDGAFLGSVQISQLKAQTSANFPFPTSAVAEIAYGKDGQPGRVPGIAQVPGVAAFAGGLPIMTADKQHVGAIGVSGARAEEDEQCAQAGIDAVSDMLN
ncbi:MAG: hypothetical protein CMM50_11280 [Rhodospirillaceae bacterium]|nr:hypothetical protein [Rhodospirillaceae bacterium]